MSLISELKRRNVVRVATAYVIVGWLLLQVSDVVIDFTEAPSWVGKVIIALLMMGFVVALVLSWLFDATPEGIKRDDGTTNNNPVRAERLNVVTIAAALGVAAMFVWQNFGDSSADTRRTADLPASATIEGDAKQQLDVIDAASIAVLPFADLSPQGDQEYFSDGIAEEILNVLVRIDGLAVASRTSSFAFKGQQALGIPVIGAELKVRHVLEGSVRSSGNSIRVTAQLIDAATDKHLWSQTYDAELSAEKLFEIQDEIATSIVAELSDSLGLKEISMEGVSVRADTENLDAYQLFLRGRQRYRVRSVSNIPGTIEVFQKAVELDPTFARAWSGLAAIASVAPSWGIPGDGEGNYALARRAAEKAMALDDSLSQPYAVLGNIVGRSDSADFAESFRLYDEALLRNPNDADALLWRGSDYLITGWFDKAIADFTRCSEIDPGYQNCQVFDTLAHVFSRDFDAAFEQYVALAGMNATSESISIAFALATETKDKRSAMLALAWGATAFDTPMAPELIYRALADPRFDSKREFDLYLARREALTGVTADNANLGVFPIFFGRYDLIVADASSMIWWHPSFPDFLASADRNRIIREIGLYDYWVATEFPPQCRVLPDDDFICD